MIYTIDEIKQRIDPVVKKYNIPEVYLFGSYARGDADDDSDVDILIEREGSAVRTMLEMGGLFEELSAAVGKPIDLVTTGSLRQKRTQTRTPWFAENLLRERMMIYGKH